MPNPIQNTQQAVAKPGSSLRPGQNPVQLELFDAEGNPWDPSSGGSLPDNLVTTDQLNAALDRIQALEDASE